MVARKSPTPGYGAESGDRACDEGVGFDESWLPGSNFLMSGENSFSWLVSVSHIICMPQRLIVLDIVRAPG